METFLSSDGLVLGYYRWGTSHAGLPVLLQHGFASTAHANWFATGIVGALLAAGRPVLALDARGHGASARPHDWNYYGEARMARDLAELLDHLGLPQVDAVGYSMGAVVALLLTLRDARVRRLVLAGVGEGLLECGGLDTRVVDGSAIIRALLAEDPRQIEHPGAAAFRAYADRSGADHRALAAQAAALHQQPLDLASLRLPCLVIAGAADPLARHPERVAAAIAGAQLCVVDGDHLAAVTEPALAAALVGFLGAGDRG